MQCQDLHAEESERKINFKGNDKDALRAWSQLEDYGPSYLSRGACHDIYGVELLKEAQQK